MPVLSLRETPPARPQGSDNRCRNRSQLKTKKGMQLCRTFSIDRELWFAQIAQNRAFACLIEKLTPRRSRIKLNNEKVEGPRGLGVRAGDLHYDDHTSRSARASQGLRQICHSRTQTARRQLALCRGYVQLGSATAAVGAHLTKLTAFLELERVTDESFRFLNAE